MKKNIKKIIQTLNLASSAPGKLYALECSLILSKLQRCSRKTMRRLQEFYNTVVFDDFNPDSQTIARHIVFTFVKFAREMLRFAPRQFLPYVLDTLRNMEEEKMLNNDEVNYIYGFCAFGLYDILNNNI